MGVLNHHIGTIRQCLIVPRTMSKSKLDLIIVPASQADRYKISLRKIGKPAGPMRARHNKKGDAGAPPLSGAD
jgi:hypothetical protein